MEVIGPRSEYELQCQIVAFVRKFGKKGIFWTAVPMGENRDVRAGLRVKRMGGRAGTPDILFCRPGLALWLEVKFGKGRPSTRQKIVFDEIEAAGGIVEVVSTFDQAVELLANHGFVRASVSKTKLAGEYGDHRNNLAT